MKRFRLALSLLLGFAACLGSAQRAPILWYTQPAKEAINEALPIGNGNMGGLICGAPDHERVVLNEDSLWTGDDDPSGDYDKMGAYQALGDLIVDLPGHKKATEYQRDLNLQDAVASVSYKAGGAGYERQFFCSHPAKVLVARFSSTPNGLYQGTISLRDAHNGTVTAEGLRLTMRGKLANGLTYETQALVVPDTGSLAADGNTIKIMSCGTFYIVIGAGTDYSMANRSTFRGEDPHQRITEAVDAAARRGYWDLLAEHRVDFRKIFSRVKLDLGRSSLAQRMLPTDLRKIEAAKIVDPELESDFFQYGRYLLISCSRPGGLPANLQGLWNDSNTPPWSSDYHANINVQMNYWPAEVANLAECHLPFFDLIESQLPKWRGATAASSEQNRPDGKPSTRGFAIRTSHNIYGGMGWRWDNTANAWYCHHLWEHYEFGGDLGYLRKVAYPILKETCEFWEDHLKRLPDGRLVVPNAWSPEHGPTEDGVSYSQEIVWDLFANYVSASRALGVDKEYAKTIAQMRDHLATPGIGSWGQLLEWMTEKKGKVPGSPELDTPEDHHRHTSHLFAVFPGHQIDFEKTPKLASAAKISLDARGETGDVREWSFAWRTALYARLHDGEGAHRMLQQLFSARNTCPNLFGLHPPMQMDGNFGISATIAETLVQSRSDDGKPSEIDLLPALPSAWPNGHVEGLKARGGAEVSLSWRNGALTRAEIIGPAGKTFRVRYRGKVSLVKIPASGKTAI